jgi:nitrogen fixation protein NifX
MIRVAFASDDRQCVNEHFGAAEQFVLYDVSPGLAQFVGLARFVKARMKGINAEHPSDEPAPLDEEERMTEDKVIAKIEFLNSCSGVYAAKIGMSSIKRLMQASIQPIIVNKGFPIIDLLNEVSLAMACGGLPWVERAQERPKPLVELSDTEPVATAGDSNVSLITSVDDIL